MRLTYLSSTTSIGTIVAAACCDDRPTKMMMVHTGTARSQLGPKASFTLSGSTGTGIWDPESRCELNSEGVEQKDEKLIRRRFSFLFLPGTELHLHCVMDFVCRVGTFLRFCGCGSVGICQ